ncbi:MAG TPA: cysteine desulfurase-like protein [Acetobacteraceae bacterium]|nr:cysteine desulfurase-like protein [Acetobacteraceae bacterium]
MTPPMESYPIEAVRAQFPALADTTRVHLDNPAGTQVPRRVAEAVSECLLRQNANLGGYFRTSREAGAIVEQAHRDAATLFGAADWREIVIGPSMTALTFLFSRALAATLAPGDEILMTTMEHDGNVAPWLAAAGERGLIVRRVPFDTETWRVEPAAFAAALSPRTRIVALTAASNLTGSLNDVAALTMLAKQAGALVYVDAVQFAPHALIDVQALGCDFLVASAYKFFGPHLGVLWARADLLRSLMPQKVRPASDDIPWRWEQGTPQIELQAGLSAAIAYLAWLGEIFGESGTERAKLQAAFAAASAWESALALDLIAGLRVIPGVAIHGVSNPNRIGFRVPTVSFTHATVPPDRIAAHLAADGICVWSGNNYAIEVVRQLGLPEAAGVLRIGLAHYNTPAEIARVLTAVRRAVGAAPQDP